MTASRDAPTRFPTLDEIVAFIRKQPRDVGTREIARAFGLKNADRAELRRMLRTLADDGVVSRGNKKKLLAGHLPDIVEADVIGRDGDGELIAVPAEWDDSRGAAPKIRIVNHRRARPGTTAGVGNRVLLRIGKDQTDDVVQMQGRVIKILEQQRSRLLGIFRALPDGSGRMVPVDKKQLGREIAIAATDTEGARDGDLISVELRKSRGYGLPAGRVREKLGSLTTERAISLIAIHAHDIPNVFPREVIAQAEAAKPAVLEGREDWRDLPLVTIDPVDAKDHDDAVHAEPRCRSEQPRRLHRHGGNRRRVPSAVTPGNRQHLDHEALKRGNSVYFPDRVVPMLPERISNDLCSLKPKEPRGALAVRMIIAKDGRKRSHTFHRILMRSAAKLSYEQAQAAIDGRTDDITGPLVEPILKPLYARLSLRGSRPAIDREPLDLDLPERKILLKPDGTVDRVVTPQRLDAHRLIEEFMILANVAAAETLEQRASPLIYRVHDEPTQEKIHVLQEVLKTLDINLAKAGALRPALFNRVLAQVKGHDAEPLVNEVVLRSQAQAEYASENYGHFGLNLRRYAHFTSPIRRYADLIVHRALVRALNLGDGALPPEQGAEALAEVAAEISMTERRAMKAERETADRLIAHFLADRIGATFTGRISGVTRSGLFVKLQDTGADGFVPPRTLGDEYFQYDESRQAMIGTRSGAMHRLGDVVEVRLVEAAPVAGALRFEILSNESRREQPARRAPLKSRGRPRQDFAVQPDRNGPNRKDRRKAKSKDKAEHRPGKKSKDRKSR